MHNLSIIANFGLDIHFQTHVPCELYVDIIPSTPKNAIRVLWTIEPNEVSGFRQAAINNCDKFDLILTWDENILNSCPNFARSLNLCQVYPSKNSNTESQFKRLSSARGLRAPAR